MPLKARFAAELLAEQPEQGVMLNPFATENPAKQRLGPVIKLARLG